VFTTSQRIANGLVTNNNGQFKESDFNICPGGTFAITFTTGNNGTQSVSFAERYYITSSSSAWSGGGTTLAVYNGFFYANALVSFNHTFIMPSFGAGTYYVYHAVDYNGQVSESREDDNVARHPYVLKVAASCF